MGDDGIIRSDGTTVLGGDDKSGVCAIIEALTTAVENNIPCRCAEIVISISEETGLRGAKELDYSKIKSRQAIVFDTGGPVGKIVYGGPGQKKIRAKVHGKKSHAGQQPEKGISAIWAAAKAVASMNLLRIDEETTANIGTFTAVGATNIVNDLVEIVAEVRSRNIEKLDRQVEHMCSCLKQACDDMGATLECEVETNYVSFTTPTDAPLVKLVSKACENIGCEVNLAVGGGGSDANVMALHGITPVIVSTGMMGAHTTEEYLPVSDLENAARLALEILKG